MRGKILFGPSINVGKEGEITKVLAEHYVIRIQGKDDGGVAVFDYVYRKDNVKILNPLEPKIA